jgi:CheY-like chemotaxis protein
MPRQSAHILLVEDNEGDILLTIEAIRESRIDNDVSVVRDGAEAINFIEKRNNYSTAHTPDLILLDINLPKRNGLEVLAYIKNNDRFKHIPVVILTTSSSPNDVLKAYNSYASSFITKPALANDFMRAIWSMEEYYTNIATIPKLSN